MRPRLTKAERAETVNIGGRVYRRFIPYPGPVRDRTVRCFACGQIDEPSHHDNSRCPATATSVGGEHD